VRGSYSVDEPEVPGVRQVVDGKRVGLGREGEDGLDSDVHDHDTLGTQVVGEDFEGIRDQETGETNGVEDAEDPDEDDLADTVTLLFAAGFVLTSQGSPDGEGDNHTSHGGEEERASSEFVDSERSGDGDNQAEGGVAKLELKLVSRDGNMSQISLTPSFWVWDVIPHDS
jgi:hypothetical protein